MVSTAAVRWVSAEGWSVAVYVVVVVVLVADGEAV